MRLRDRGRSFPRSDHLLPVLFSAIDLAFTTPAPVA
jgi:hypothetical protein